jgi:trans-aconitate 2-methyltransferase
VVNEESSSATRWDPNQYLRFADHRLRPALELLARVPLAEPAIVYDLGCGAGNVTRVLAERWPAARISGVDSSLDMLAAAARASAAIRWIEADLRLWCPDTPPDLLYSNAALHWLDGHAERFPRLLATLRPGGCLAIQMPLSWHLASHRLMRETLADGGAGGRPLGTEALRHAAARNPVGAPSWYYDLLVDRAPTVDVWTTEYLQVLVGDDPVLEWVRATGLRPIVDGLDETERAVFVAEYARRLRAAYPRRADGRTLYPFQRLFIVATA